VLLNPFVEIWLGSNYVLGIEVSIALAVSFFIEGLRNSGYTYRTTLGLFQKGRTTPYIGAITNIVFSILLCKLFGVAGIFMATSIAQLVSYSWIDPYLIHKYEFKTPVSKYFRKFLKYLIVYSIECCITLFFAFLVKNSGIIGLFLKALIVCIIPNVINLIVFHNTSEFNELKKKLFNPILKN
jgi:O-antigen/teichoic acid export membrane protein